MEFDYQKQPGIERKRFYSPDPKDALVSVITPYYNAGKYFEQTFNSVMNQTFPWFEWIIVDDGSTSQEDVEILNHFASLDSRIKVITQENAGVVRARNTGIAYTNTNLVVPLDADDLISPTYLECLYWSLYFNPDAAWSFCDSYGFQEQEYLWKYPFDSEYMKKENLLVVTAMIRKKDMMEVGGYKPEKWHYHEDWRFWLEMMALGKKPIHISTPMFWYRRTDNGMLTTVEQNPEKERFNNDIIKRAAAEVHDQIKAIEFPVISSQIPFYKSKKIEWTRKNCNKKSKKHIMWLLPWVNMGGADKFNLDAIAGLKQNDFESYVLTTVASENGWKQRFEEYTDELFFMADFLDPANYMEFISYFIQSRDIDVIMLSNSYDGYYMLPWLRQQFPDVAIVDYVHMEEWYWQAGGYARTSGVQSQIIEKTYVCNSQTQKVLVEHFKRNPETVDCLHIGVDYELFDRDHVSPGYLHNMLKLPNDRPIVLFPCRIDYQKRPFMMLDIAEGVRKNIPQIVFVVVGSGDLLDELKNKIKCRNLQKTVYCIGTTSEMRACYRDSKLTLICSLKEGLALTAYESLSMGVPVVSSNVGGQGDLVGSDVGALLPLRQEERDILRENYDSIEIQDYVDNICRILQNVELYKQLSENCRKKIVKDFSIKKMVDTLTQELTWICTDENCRIKRHAVAAALNMVENLPADYYTIYQQWAIERECSGSIWNARCWFERLYHQTQTELEAVQNYSFKELVYQLLRKIKLRIKRIFS